MDIEVTNEEGATIMEALASMKDFERIKTTVLSADTTFSFSENPVLYHTNRSRDSIKVYAVVELFGLTFTQGSWFTFPWQYF